MSCHVKTEKVQDSTAVKTFLRNGIRYFIKCMHFQHVVHTPNVNLHRNLEQHFHKIDLILNLVPYRINCNVVTYIAILNL